MTRTALLLVCATVAGCGRPAPAADEAPAASVEARSEALPASPDTTAHTARTAPDSAQRIIGRDSAFGPLFAVDSLGRPVELPARRP